MTKTYSTRSNARRAAEKAGLTAYRLESVSGGIAVVADTSTGEPAAEAEFTPPTFLARDAVANPTQPRAEERTWEGWNDDCRKAAADLAPAHPRPIDASIWTEEEKVVSFALNRLTNDYGMSFSEDEMTVRGVLEQVFRAGLAAAPTAARKPRAERAPRREGPTKRQIAAGLLTRPEGTTTREILDATGWPAVSVPAIAKASGLTLRQEKDGRVTRYFAEAA